MVKSIVLSLTFFFCFNSIAFTADNNRDTIFTAFWNLENLFDTKDDPVTRDEEFMPGTERDWTDERLDIKLYNLSRVIRSMNDNKGPDILGVCEVEHEFLLQDMISKYLQDMNYSVVYSESPDERGIDNGLIFNKNKFKLISFSADTINLPGEDQTRSILRTDLMNGKDDTLYIFVNHWPSRSGGQIESEPDRISAAKTLRENINKLFLKNKDASIIILGDLNDEPTNVAVLNVLVAQPFLCDSTVITIDKELVNLSFDLYSRGEGSYKYRDDWNMLDQIIVSGNLISGKIKYLCDSFDIYKPYFLITKSGKYEGTPFPTYGGRRYLGGYSDHFPVTAEFLILK